MTTIDQYVASLSGIRAQRITMIINYIRETYPDAKESLDYSPKWKYPIFRLANVYVTIANMKNYISLHFGKYDATKIIKELHPEIKIGVGCVNIKDSTEFPLQAIKKAINYCFDQ